MNSLENTTGGETTEEALSSLPRQQLKHRAAQGHLKMLTVAVHGVDPLCSAAPRQNRSKVFLVPLGVEDIKIQSLCPSQGPPSCSCT